MGDGADMWGQAGCVVHNSKGPSVRALTDTLSWSKVRGGVVLFYNSF